jgi:hypothetical protein
MGSSERYVARGPKRAIAVGLLWLVVIGFLVFVVIGDHSVPLAVFSVCVCVLLLVAAVYNLWAGTSLVAVQGDRLSVRNGLHRLVVPINGIEEVQLREFRATVLRPFPVLLGRGSRTYWEAVAERRDGEAITLLALRALPDTYKSSIVGHKLATSQALVADLQDRLSTSPAV